MDHHDHTAEPDQDDLAWARDDLGPDATDEEVYEVAARRARERAREDQAIYRTVYQVEVFSRGRFGPLTPSDSDPFELAEINHAITEGDCIGNVELVSQQVVAIEKVEAELLRIGNDGAFFGDV